MRIVIYPSKFSRFLFLALGLATLTPMVATDRSFIPALIFFISVAATVHVNTTRIVLEEDRLVLFWFYAWPRAVVQTGILKRIEYYPSPSPFSLGPNYIFRLEDEAGNTMQIYTDIFKYSDMCQLAQALQKSIAASPDGDKKDFVALNYIQGKSRL